MPGLKKNTTHAPKKSKAFYSQKPPGPVGQASSLSPYSFQSHPNPLPDLPHAKPLAPSHFTLREDGSIAPEPAKHAERAAASPSPLRSGGEGRDEEAPRAQGEPPSTLDARPLALPKLIFHDEPHRVWLYHGNCLELLDAIYDRHGAAGRFDCIFADPPYFLSNGGITCHAGRMVKSLF